MDTWSTLDPLDYYKQELEPTHRRNVADTFNELIRQSGVDLKANHAGVRKLNLIGEAVKKADASVSNHATLGTVFTIASVVTGLAVGAHIIFLMTDSGPIFSGKVLLWLSAGFVAAMCLLFFWIKPALRSASDQRTKLLAAYKKQRDLLFEQVAPLNALITWDTVPNLIRKTLPTYSPDPYVTDERLRELRDRYGWNGALIRTASVLAVQSGTIAGNPFFFVRVKEVRMTPKQYEGSRTVHWTEREHDSNGRTHTVHHSQTLYATVTHNAPEFPEFSFVLYGHDAAPGLSFTRKPSKYSGGDGGLFRRWGKRRETKKLEAFSRNLNDEYGFTMMANREFETLFHSTDRSDEAAFRLLFTPFAQQQTVRLLNDTTIGYGDDFTFVKEKKVNIIVPEHLKNASLSSDPDRFRGYDIEAMRRKFFDGITEDLHHLWFGLAPLLCIPLYRNPSPMPQGYGGDAPPTGDWEHEIQANLIGIKAFRPARCITDCILKSQTVSLGGSTAEAKIKAVGFSGHSRTDYVSKMARNGNVYNVPVKWTEYSTVRKTTVVRFTATNSAAHPRHIRSEIR